MQKPALTRTISVMTNEPVKKTAESVIKSIPESKIKEHDKPFNEVWSFPQDIIKTIPTATRYEVLPSEMKYSSGRDKFVCFFYDKNNKMLAKHLAMQLVSKKNNKNYFVVMLENMRE